MTEKSRIYYLGLGFLYGYNCERDTDKAHKLISTAAYLGSITAMYKLAIMYKSGWGVDCNAESSIYWFENTLYEFDRRIKDNTIDEDEDDKLDVSRECIEKELSDYQEFLNKLNANKNS